jgi:hypothetical protein
MVDKNTIKNNLNPRLKEIDMMVDSMIPNDYINTLILKYKNELLDYDYIDTPELFSTLRLRGSMRYINKFDKNLRFGGLLTKIYQKNGKWIGIILQNNKKYYVSFEANYIFYLNTKSELVRDWADCFITELDKGNIEY